MDFRLRHSFAAPPERVAQTLLDPAFQASLSDVGSLAERTVLSQIERSGTTVRRVRCVLDLELSGMAKSILGDADPAWVEEAVWHPQAMAWEWKIEPEVAADLLSAAGRIEIAPEGEGTERVVTGSVKVRVPLYGGKVERWVVEGVQRAYEEEAQRLRDWLLGHAG